MGLLVERRAAGGFACVSTGEMPLNFEEARTLFQERKIDFDHYEGKDFEIAKTYADRIKAQGALCYFEFSHEGSRAEESKEPWGPEDWTRDDGVQVKGMDEAMMAKVCDDYYRISKFARACGFDGILLHGGHGFQLQQFISPWTNHRTDEYGGSMENRARFPKRIIEACRAGIGEDRVIELRYSAEDGVPGGMTIDDTVEFCKEIDGMVDIIQISNGLKWLGSRTKTFSSFLEPHGLNVEYAAKVKAAVEKSYVSVIGGFNGPEMAEQVIAEGKTDFVEFGRQGFADPAMPNKALEGKEDTIRRCVRCFNCYPGFCEHPTDIPLWEKIGPEAAQKIYSPASMGSCAINPKTGFGFYPETLPEPEGSRKVLIVGGGVGGCQAAVTAAERGHQVILCEKTDRLGGTINFTDKDEDKADLMNAKNVIIRDALNSGAEIRMNTEVDKALIDEIRPDAIIIAVGAHPFVPSIPGIEKAINALYAYDRMDELGREVVIVGGDCETVVTVPKRRYTVKKTGLYKCLCRRSGGRMEVIVFEEYYREPDPVKRKELLDGYCPDEGDRVLQEQMRILFDLRYKHNRNGGYDDCFLRSWLDLKLAAGAPGGMMSKKRGIKQVRAAVHQLCLDRRDEFSGEILYEEMCHLTTAYIFSCLQDSKYTGVFWGLGKISDERQRSRVTADLEELVQGISRYPDVEKDIRILKRAIEDTENMLLK
ncbi:MAG: FAD-dependent oxidoreductase [Clostridiales bacterium]|nr:FAD-dependent oxidoreductase [Clostridiales bacterium]